MLPTFPRSGRATESSTQIRVRLKLHLACVACAETCEVAMVVLQSYPLVVLGVGQVGCVLSVALVPLH